MSKIDPEVAAQRMRARGVEPLEPYPGHCNVVWRCRCLTCGREVTPRYRSSNSTKWGCRYCASRGPLDPEVAVAFMRSRGLEPLDPFRNVDDPWRCLCLQCDREVTPRYNRVQAGQGGCKYCAAQHFKYDGPASVYLLVNRDLGALKIGVTSQSVKRLNEHRARGWTLFRSLAVPTGHEAIRIERAVLATWRAAGLPPYVTRAQMPQGGWTETVDLEEVGLLGGWEAILAAR